MTALAEHAAQLLAAVHAGHDRSELRSQREAIEAELQDMETFVADAQSISRTGSWMWNPTNPEIGEWSAETYKMLGYDPSQTKASFENNFARVHPEDKERYLAEVTAAADNEKDLDVQYRYLLPDGTVRHVHARGRRLSPTLYIGTANDITQRRAAEAAIRDAQIELASASRLSTLGELVTSISHELNQPLAAVVANAGAAKRWLVRDPPDLDSARESIETLVEDAKRAQAVIDSLRALARRSEPERRALDLNQAVIEIAPLAQSELRSRNISLELCLHPGTPLLFADRVQVQQVSLTLLMTCLDHVDHSVESDRVLILRTSRSDDEVIISVDGPCQIDRHFLERHVSPEDLIGQRLAIIVCRSIVEAHGGRLRLSDGMMPNSLLEVTFPFLVVSSQPQESRS
ncbi:PAS domain-containing protein [Sinorhizobium medicae]|uniref:PAS domain-containing protein n=1 Tax=Sinorhizobium medicae TaxID=110321 RepID=UPI001AED2B62|nr:PAS domain-containing protein [Sinorhizobium medicae]